MNLDNLNINNLNIEDLREVSDMFKNLFNGLIELCMDLTNGIKKMNEYWVGPKFHTFLDKWNNIYTKELFQIIYYWDYSGNSTFKTVVLQYEDSKTNYEVNVDDSSYNFLKNGIEEIEYTGTTYVMSQVQKIFMEEIKASAGNIPQQIRNTVTNVTERLEGARSPALTSFLNNIEDLANQYANKAKDDLDTFCSEIQSRINEIEGTERNIYEYVNNL